MKKVLFSFAILSVSAGLSAQTAMPDFSKLGYKKSVMYTSSKGEFEEFHDQKNVVEIGTVLFNTKTNHVVGFVSEEKAETDVAAATTAMSVDPMCEKYYWISPYAYALNNPVRYTDPTGKWIVGTDGKPVTYNQEKGWSPNTSTNVQEIGNAMMLTPEGKKVFNDMSVAKYSITINYKEGFNSENHDKLGETKINHTGDKINSVEINLFEGKIQEDVSEYQQASQLDHKLQDPTVKQQLLLEQTPTMTERIGQVGAHEGTHATDPNAMYHKVGVANAERKADTVEMKAIEQTTEFNRPIPVVIEPLKIP